MRQHSITVTKAFSDWARDICNENLGTGCHIEFPLPMTGKELGDAILEFTYSVPHAVDLIADECRKLVNNRESRAIWRRIDRSAHDRDSRTLKPLRMRFKIFTREDFKVWFDSGKDTLSEPGIPPLTGMEFADALMFFVERHRYCQGEDIFGKFCKEVAAGKKGRRAAEWLKSSHKSFIIG